MRSSSHAQVAFTWSERRRKYMRLIVVAGTLTVAAHDARDTGHDGAHERVEVDLVLRTVIDVGRLLCAAVLLLAVTHERVSSCLITSNGDRATHLLMKCFAQA